MGTSDATGRSRKTDLTLYRMQIDQLFEFVYVLIEKKQVTAKEMAERFGVSTRTIYRWMDALAVSGVPVYALKGRGGGIAISEQYAMDKTVLSEEERLAIVSSVKALNVLNANSASQTNSGTKAAEKLSNLVTTNTDWLEVDFAPWSPEGSGVRELFGMLRDSILKKQQVSFDYFTGDGRTERRTVHPWMLVYRGQAWYLYGWCTVRNAERFFKLSRMVNVEQTKRPATVTIQDAKNDSPPVAANTASLITINATVSAAKAGFLLDTFFCTQTQVHQDGSLTATFTAPDTDWLISMLLSFGPELKIISPEKVKKQVALLAEKTAELYENS